jgi:hypothetical protein
VLAALFQILVERAALVVAAVAYRSIRAVFLL